MRNGILWNRIPLRYTVETQKSNSTGDKEINLGLCLLRMWMCFEVVLFHFWRGAGNVWFLKPFEMLKYVAVSVFMVMSFYLTASLFTAGDPAIIKKRMWRITWPQLGWALLYAIFLKSSFSDLLLQMLFGHSLNRSMWYQFDLIVITAAFFLLFAIFSKGTALLLVAYGALIALFVSYSAWHFQLYYLFPDTISVPLGRLVEMTPMAVTGFLMGYTDTLNQMRKARWRWIGGVLLLFPSVFFRGIFGDGGGFGYGGLKLIALAVLFIMEFYLLPLEKLPDILKRAIMIVSRHTLGIYCVHRLVQAFLPSAYRGSGFTDCVLLYILSWGLCELISRIPVKWVRQLVD